jgi:peptidoglycan/xylan/chitin deacetylase (PgdA/CDA1 family)
MKKTLSAYFTERKGRFSVLLLIGLAVAGAYALDLGPTVSQEASVIKSDDGAVSDASSTDDVIAIEEISNGTFDEVSGGDGLAYAGDTTATSSDTDSTNESTSAVSSSTSGTVGTAIPEGSATVGEETATTTNEEVSGSRKSRSPRYPGMYPGGGGSSSGGSTPTNPTVPTADITGPIGAFTAPLNGTTITIVGTSLIQTSVIDPVILNALTSGVAEVSFLLDGNVFSSTILVSPTNEYSFALTDAIPAGVHTLGVLGKDSAGNSGATTTVTVTIAYPATDTTAPVVELLGALQGTIASGTLAITASATDPVVVDAPTSGVAELAFLVDNTLIATTSTPTSGTVYGVSLDTLAFPLINGEHVLSVRALDYAGNMSAFAYATVTVANTVPDPVVPNPFVRGGVSLTFDDANATQYQYVFPLLQAYNQSATLYVPTGLIETTGYMTWGQIGELKNGGWEIGGHTVNHAELPLLADSEKEQEVAGSLEALEDKGFMATSFATPFGAYDPATIATIAESYDSHRNFHHLALNKWPYNKYFLQIERVTSSTTPAEVAGWVDQAIAQDAWLIVVLHEVMPLGEVGDEWSWTTENLAETLNYLKTTGVKTKTVADMLSHGTNLVPNGTFAGGLGTQGNGWWTNDTTNVTLDSSKHGSYPEALNSIKFEGNPIAPSHLFGPMMTIEPAELYGIRFYVNAKDFVSGELGFYIDEYDTVGNWLSGKWLGMAGNSWVIDESYAYTATSANVSQVSLQVYATAGSIGTAYIDSVEFFKPE